MNRPNKIDKLLFSVEPLFDRPYPHVPDKGSLALRSQHVNYGRGVLNSGWHEAREAEPKDVDINKAKERDLHRSTYNRMATLTDGSIPSTTYQDFGRQVTELKRYYAPQDWRKQLVRDETFHSSILDRETGRPKTGNGAAIVLPQAPPVFREYMTTTVDHYRRPFPQLPSPIECAAPDWSRAVRLTVSQFTDTDNHRRVGRNHWQDETGHYFNSHLKNRCPYYQRRVPPFKDRE